MTTEKEPTQEASEFKKIISGQLTGRGEALVCLIIVKHLAGKDVESIGREVYTDYGRRLSVHYINSVVWLYSQAIQEAKSNDQ